MIVSPLPPPSIHSGKQIASCAGFTCKVWPTCCRLAVIVCVWYKVQTGGLSLQGLLASQVQLPVTLLALAFAGQVAAA